MRNREIGIRLRPTTRRMARPQSARQSACHSRDITGAKRGSRNGINSGLSPRHVAKVAFFARAEERRRVVGYILQNCHCSRDANCAAGATRQRRADKVTRALCGMCIVTRAINQDRFYDFENIFERSYKKKKRKKEESKIRPNCSHADIL